jgi:hypothetical protein
MAIDVGWHADGREHCKSQIAKCKLKNEKSQASLKFAIVILQFAISESGRASVLRTK